MSDEDPLARRINPRGDMIDVHVFLGADDVLVLDKLRVQHRTSRARIISALLADYAERHPEILEGTK